LRNAPGEGGNRHMRALRGPWRRIRTEKRLAQEGLSRRTMTRTSMLIPPEELAAIDEVASPNRTAFMLRVVNETVAR